MKGLITLAALTSKLGSKWEAIEHLEVGIHLGIYPECYKEVLKHV